MNEFKKVSGEFRSTWENAINLDDEPKENKQIETEPWSDDSLETENTIGQNSELTTTAKSNGDAKMPEIKEVSNAEFDKLVEAKKKEKEKEKELEVEISTPEKSDWL